MNKIVTLLIFLLTLSLSLSAQKEDYIWLTGYSSNTVDSTVGGTRIDFNTEPPTVTYEFREMDFYLADASICDSAGNLLFYTDATTVMSSNHEIMENGENLGPHPFHQSYALDGVVLMQGAIILKLPGEQDSLYIVVHMEFTDDPSSGTFVSVKRCFYSLVNINANNGLGEVVQKNQLIVSDSLMTLNIGNLTATRHANGRDWWVLIPKYLSNEYHTIRIGQNGVEETFSQTIGMNILSSTSTQAVFSPDGSRFARFGIFRFSQPGQIDLYDFDRCSGILSNSLHIPIDTTEEGFVDGAFGGLAFSPNSQLLYHSRNFKTVQYDLVAPDIIASADTVAVYDGFQDPIIGFETLMGAMQLAPNNKIYMATPGNTRYMHIIHNPDERGAACNFEQHGLPLATFNDWSVPNYPNYRLGALPDSPCDTIRPIADFSYDSIPTIWFTDLSARTPTRWQWAFGDGATSNEQNPLHTYAAAGTYQVCLVASNDAGSDTTCQDVVFTPTHSHDLTTPLFSIFPNPAQQHITVSLPDANLRTWQLTNTLGQVIQQGTFTDSQQVLQLNNKTSGVYFLQVEGLGVERIVVN